MKLLKNSWLIFILVCFAITSIAFFAAAINSAYLLTYACLIDLGFTDITDLQISTWDRVSIVWTLIGGILAEFKEKLWMYYEVRYVFKHKRVNDDSPC